MDDDGYRAVAELAISAINELADHADFHIFQFFMLPMINPNRLSKSRLSSINLSKIVENFSGFIFLLEQVIAFKKNRDDFYSVMVMVELIARSLYHAKAIFRRMKPDQPIRVDDQADRVLCLMIRHCKLFYNDAFRSLRERHSTLTGRNLHPDRVMLVGGYYDYPLSLRGGFMYLHEVFIKKQFEGESVQFSDFFRFYLLTSGSFSYGSLDQQEVNNRIVHISLSQLIKLIEICVHDKTELSVLEREKLLIELINYTDTIAFRKHEDGIKEVASRLLSIANRPECEELKKYIHMLLIRIMPPDQQLLGGVDFSSANSMVISARSGDYYSRTFYMLHLMGFKLDFVKGFRGCDDVLLPDIAMKLLTYNASLEIRHYQKYLSHELISSMVSEFFHKKGGCSL
ncbi:hypothetical protein [Endozoicomonas sp.]|uniref:hypothetical protein n=1 Tax=Endozoicomonas sp. TaxID=1892382 RepID=UPI003AF83273